MDISIDGTYLYTFSKDRRNGISYLEIFDISNPASLQQVGNLTLNNADAISIGIKDHALYIYEDLNEKILVIDVSDPTKPTYVGFVQMTFIVHSIYIHDNLALLANAGLGLSVLDITKPLEPVLLPTFELKEGALMDVTAKGEYVFLPRGPNPGEDFGEFLVLDASNPSQMELVASFVIETPRNPSGPHSITFEGNLVAMALQGSPSNLVVLVDISDPTSPQQKGDADVPEELNSVQGGIVMQDGLIYVAATTGIAIYEIVY